MELESELELILQTLLSPLWTPNLAGWLLRIRGPHSQSHATLRCRDHATHKKPYISIFTRATAPKLSRVGRHPQSQIPLLFCGHVTQTLYLYFHMAYGLWL